jgi:hypothetical protein
MSLENLLFNINISCESSEECIKYKKSFRTILLFGLLDKRSSTVLSTGRSPRLYHNAGVNIWIGLLNHSNNTILLLWNSGYDFDVA